MKSKNLLTLLMLGLGTFLNGMLYAQTHKVSGRVVAAEDKEPTSIFMIKNMGNGTDICTGMEV